MTTPHAKLIETANGQDNALNVNEALAWIDVLLKTPVISRTLTAAPGSPADGDFYIMASSWAGVTGAAANALALYRTSLGWQARTPETGWIVEDATDGNLYRFSGSAWVLQPKGIAGVSNSGSGAQVLVGVDGSRNVVARRLVAGSNVTITQNTNDITISASGGGGGGGGSTITQTDSASLPAASAAGNVSLLTDKNILVFDSGTAWLPWGPVNRLIAPPNSGWSWVNQGASTITSSDFDQVLKGGGAGSGANAVARVRSAPSTPYTITVFVQAIMAQKAFQSYGLCFRDSASGRLAILDIIATDDGLTTVAARATKFNSGTSFNSDYITLKLPQKVHWLRIADDGVNRVCSISEDGQNWMAIHTVGRTDFLTADQVGIVVGVENSAAPNLAPTMRVLSWEET